MLLSKAANRAVFRLNGKGIEKHFVVQHKNGGLGIDSRPAIFISSSALVGFHWRPLIAKTPALDCYLIVYAAVASALLV
jgi:hypothetical protein